MFFKTIGQIGGRLQQLAWEAERAATWEERLAALRDIRNHATALVEAVAGCAEQLSREAGSARRSSCCDAPPAGA